MESVSSVESQAKTESQPKLVPVSYISANSVTSCESETEKLVGMFLDYQGNPAYNEKDNLARIFPTNSRCAAMAVLVLFPAPARARVVSPDLLWCSPIGLPWDFATVGVLNLGRRRIVLHRFDAL
jgi:hypothetical protein